MSRTWVECMRQCTERCTSESVDSSVKMCGSRELGHSDTTHRSHGFGAPQEHEPARLHHPSVRPLRVMRRTCEPVCVGEVPVGVQRRQLRCLGEGLQDACVVVVGVGRGEGRQVLRPAALHSATHWIAHASSAFPAAAHGRRGCTGRRAHRSPWRCSAHLPVCGGAMITPFV